MIFRPITGSTQGIALRIRPPTRPRKRINGKLIGGSWKVEGEDPALDLGAGRLGLVGSRVESDHRHAFLELLFRECAEREATLLYVSHDPSLAGELDDRGGLCFGGIPARSGGSHVRLPQRLQRLDEISQIDILGFSDHQIRIQHVRRIEILPNLLFTQVARRQSTSIDVFGNSPNTTRISSGNAAE